MTVRPRTPATSPARPAPPLPAAAVPTPRTVTAPSREDVATPGARPAWHRRRGVRPVAHYLEMVVAMMVAMVVLAPLSHLLWGVLGVDLDAARWAVVAGLVMALDMTVGMAAWMLVRRHAARHVLDMSAAMLLPAAVVAVLELAGLVDRSAAGVVAHVGMYVLMAVVVVRHRHG